MFSYIVYKSRQHRDAVNAKVMKDPLMNDPKYKDKPMPFDMKRFAYGGFSVWWTRSETMKSLLVTCYVNPDLDEVAGVFGYAEFLRK